jgi:CheY-like chemotaxis protein
MSALLVVDDDPTIRTMFARALKSLGEVDLAAHGGEALRMLGSKRYDVVLLDLHMPVMDGFVVLHTLANKPGPNKLTPVFVVTADASEQARIRALRRHAVFLLTKPVPIATLCALVESTLKKAATRGAAATQTPAVRPPDPEPDGEDGRGSSPPRSSDPGKRPGSNPSWGDVLKKKSS